MPLQRPDGQAVRDESLTGADIKDGTIATVDIANNAITTDKILEGTILSSDISDGTIATVDIADGAITSAKILDNTITGLDVLDKSIKPIDLDLSTQSAFLATVSTTQALSANVWTKLNFPVGVYDNQAEYTTTSSRFTAKEAGIYRVNASVGWSAGSSATNVSLVVYKNGVLNSYLSRVYTNIANNDVSSGSCLLKLIVNDYIEIYANASKARTIRNSTTECYFSMIKEI